MTALHNPYVTLALLCVLALLDKYVNPMEEESLRSSKDSQESTTEGSPQESQQKQVDTNDKEITVEEEEELLPLSFHCTLTEETLHNDE